MYPIRGAIPCCGGIMRMVRMVPYVPQLCDFADEGSYMFDHPNYSAIFGSDPYGSLIGIQFTVSLTNCVISRKKERVCPTLPFLPGNHTAREIK